MHTTHRIRVRRIARLPTRIRLKVTDAGLTNVPNWLGPVDGWRQVNGHIVEIAAEPPRAGRLSLTLRYRAGLDRVRTSYWVEPEHEVALRRLVDAVATTKGQA